MQVRTWLRQFHDPDLLGDFLTGLFALAREQVQRQRNLVLSIHETLVGYSDDDFRAKMAAEVRRPALLPPAGALSAAQSFRRLRLVWV